MDFGKLQKAQLLINQQRFEAAKDYLLDYISMYPQEAWAYVFLGICARGLKNKEEADFFSKRAIELEADDELILFERARVLDYLERYNEAETIVRQVIRKNPYDPDYYGFLAKLLLQKGNEQDGLLCIRQGLELDPNHEYCQYLKVLSQNAKGKTEHSIKDLKRILSIAPESTIAHNSMGWTLLEKGEVKAALGAFQTTLEIDPSDELAKEGLMVSAKSLHSWYHLLYKAKDTLGMTLLVMQIILVVGFMRMYYAEMPFWGKDMDFSKASITLTLCLLVITAAASAFDALANLIYREEPILKNGLSESQLYEGKMVAWSLTIAAVLIGINHWLQFTTFYLIAILLIWFPKVMLLRLKEEPEDVEVKHDIYLWAYIVISVLAVLESIYFGEMPIFYPLLAIAGLLVVYTLKEDKLEVLLRN